MHKSTVVQYPFTITSCLLSSLNARLDYIKVSVKCSATNTSKSLSMSHLGERNSVSTAQFTVSGKPKAKKKKYDSSLVSPVSISIMCV